MSAYIFFIIAVKLSFVELYPHFVIHRVVTMLSDLYKCTIENTGRVTLSSLRRIDILPTLSCMQPFST